MISENPAISNVRWMKWWASFICFCIDLQTQPSPFFENFFQRYLGNKKYGLWLCFIKVPAAVGGAPRMSCNTNLGRHGLLSLSFAYYRGCVYSGSMMDVFETYLLSIYFNVIRKTKFRHTLFQSKAAFSTQVVLSQEPSNKLLPQL